MWRFLQPNAVETILVLLLLPVLPTYCYDCWGCQPQQVHLAFGDKPNEIVVMWASEEDTDESIVNYWTENMNQSVSGKGWRVNYGTTKEYLLYMHRVNLTGLAFNQTYFYNAGSKYAWSERFSFRTPPAGEDWVVSAAIYGDLGLDNAHSLSYLQEETEFGNFHFIIHVGDFAYDLDTEDGAYGDQFFKQIQPIAATVPYMVCTGNHEATPAFDFSHYKNRFSMPGPKNDSMFYSWNIGPVHFVAFSTEFYYDNATTNKNWLQDLKEQLKWIRADLTEATKEENRNKRPWIIMYGHRPFYCSSEEDECALPDVPQRAGAGLPEPDLGLEPVLKEFGVDMVIFGHEHSYERTLPMYNFTIYNGTGHDPYVNPRAPVNLVTGSAGCSEGTYVIKKKKPWTMFASSDYGYTRFKAYNKTHLFFEQVSVDQKGEVIDSFWLVRENHTAYDI